MTRWAYHSCMSERLSFTLEIDRDLEPPRGTIVDPAGSTLAFTGWMQLASVLSDACGRATKPEAPPDISG